MNGVISGTGDLNVNGTGTVTLGANDTYSGNTSINNGTLVVAGGAISGSGWVSTAVNGTLQVGNGTANGALAALSGAGGLWNYGNLVFNQASGNTTVISIALGNRSTGNVTQSGVNTTVSLGNNINTGGISALSDTTNCTLTSGSQRTAIAIIEKASVTISGLSASNKVYDTTTNVDISSQGTATAQLGNASAANGSLTSSTAFGDYTVSGSFADPGGAALEPSSSKQSLETR
ncbi:hypothetical protein [Pandoraea sp. NPDC090278]|uniref:hypothetical protein n=1 Tax=Pandoraea sp. NPDC090278 TaxID=3364391 RepID=UPI00383A25DA